MRRTGRVPHTGAMPSTLPDGEPAPPTGALPASALDGIGERPFGIYVHVPFCATRCGYCDFNTYTATELGGGASQSAYAGTVVQELAMARRVLGDRELPVTTVFVGGGTPTLLPAEDLVAVLRRISDDFGLAPDAEITTEANPESVDPPSLETLRAGGFTRISLGMQSSAPRVLATLDRHHTPGRPAAAVKEAQAAGFEHVNLDLIYGTPGETDADWEGSLDAATGTGADHISAYSLIVEPGTAMASQIARGVLPMPDDDVLADRYLMAEATLRTAGFDWYEVSNWARSAGARCRHNELYWTGGDWWGAGPGAHSHVGGVRWWNVKHPAAYAARLAEDTSPAAAREVLDDSARRMEDVLLRIRLRGGLPLASLSEPGRAAAAVSLGDGLLDPASHAAGRLVLTLRGRLLADAVAREIVD
jgi:putative oxygen-independent coproporphyrinogen III oxidase